jgi:hypothetical protein
MDSKSAYTFFFLKEAGEGQNEDLSKTAKNTWWWNYRNKETGGLRLTDDGFTFITNKTEIRSYKVDFPKDFKITPQTLIYLDQFMDSPFYINKSSITVFNEKSALELYLFSGDVKKMGYVKALKKRLNQE